jgi:hypothetical protein
MKQFLIKFALIAASACAALTAAQAQPVKSLKVELLIFSGRPNPTYVITDQNEINEILGTAKSLPQNDQLKAGDSGLPEPKLGYQGFKVTNLSDDSTEIKSFQVHGSAVQLAVVSGTAGKKAMAQQSPRVDRGNALESKLLSHGKEKGVIDDKLIELIEANK